MTWRKELTNKLKFTGDKFEDLIIKGITEEELDIEFNCGFGSIEGKPFRAWSKDFVYICCCYDGAEWVEAIHRNPVENKILSEYSGCTLFDHVGE